MNRNSQYCILLPRRGLLATSGTPARSLLGGLPTVTTRTGAPTIGRLEVGDGIPVRIVDTVHRFGPRLIQLNEWSQREIELRVPELRVARLVRYRRAVMRQRPLVSDDQAVEGRWVVKVWGPDHRGVPDVRVSAFENGGQGGWYGEATTDHDGVARLDPPMGVEVCTMSAQPMADFWGRQWPQVPTGKPARLELAPIDPNFIDALRFYYDQPAFDASQGVTVGVVDDGIEEHLDLAILGGRNTVVGEPDGNYSSIDQNGHGTHVAGIIAAASRRHRNRLGVAPGALVRSYRVFPEDGWFASNYSIVKALVASQEDGCHLVNLSLEATESDSVLPEAIDDVREHGMVVIAAAGNCRGPVPAPGSCPGALAVAAFGRVGTFPDSSVAATYISERRGSDQAEFVASFSNRGEDINCIAPGVGIVSTLPGDRYGPRSGTSMAAPVISGIVASLLSRSPEVLSMAKSRKRAMAIERLLAMSSQMCGFGLEYEGFGRPRG